MFKTMTALAGICCFAYNAYSGCGSIQSESLDDWILGTNEPEIRTGYRSDGSTGNYIHIPVGTSPFYSEILEEGEGSITFWIKDPGNCLDDPNPGYPDAGPMWGLQTSSYAAVCVGIGRAAYAAGCQGYSPWSTVAPYSFTWFKDGVRASHNHPFTPGWYKWTVAGGWDDISFTLHDVTYEIADGAPHDDDTFGDLVRTFDATSQGGAWEAVFGDGWNAFYLRGDAPGGIEPVDLQIVSSSGVFEQLPADCFSPSIYNPLRFDTTVAGTHYSGSLPDVGASTPAQLRDFPDGMTLDNENVLQWDPTEADTGHHSISAYVSGSGCGCPYTSSIDLTVRTASSPSHITDIYATGSGIRFSGNPFKGALTVTAPDAILRIDILDMEGTTVDNARPESETFVWEAAAPAGIYVVRITTDAGIFMKNIMKSGQ